MHDRTNMKVVVTIKDEELDNLEDIVNNFKSKGFEVQDIFEFGVIIGDIDNPKIIKEYPEVLTVTEEQWVSSLLRYY